MRLKPSQIQQIFYIVAEKITADFKIYVFGSKLNDKAKGGDIDLIIHLDVAIDNSIQARIKDKLEQELYLPFDVLWTIKDKELDIFQQLAMFDAVEIKPMTKVETKKQLLSDLLIAIERCANILQQSRFRVEFPLSAKQLKNSDIELLEKLSSINERFAKLQDIMAQAMQHGVILIQKNHFNFLKILAFYEKVGAIQDATLWYKYRETRNEATHDYGIDYQISANHFNNLIILIEPIIADANSLVEFVKQEIL